MTKGSAQSRLAALEENYSLFCQNHSEILNLDELVLGHDYFQSNLADLAEESYYDCKGEFTDFLDGVVPISPPPINAAPASADIDSLLGSSLFHSMPKIDLPRFSDKHVEWENFKDIYESLIHRNAKMTPVVKLFYLRTHISGEALDKIKSIPLRNDNYTRTWQLLDKYYENKRRLVNAHLTDFFAVKTMKSEVSSELKRLIKEIFCPLETLSSLGRAVDGWDNLVVFITIGRLGPNARKEWERFLGKTDQPPTCEQLKEFLDTHLITLEAIEGGQSSTVVGTSKTVSTYSKSGKGGGSSSAHSLQASPSLTTKGATTLCPVCQQIHYIAVCNVFKLKSPQERRDFVVKERLCFNCLGKHPVQKCRSDRRCWNCKGKHHTLLHIHSNPSSSAREQSQSPPEKVAETPNNVVIEKLPSIPASTHLTRISPSSFSQVLLATARIYVEVPNGMKILARALVDQCSHVSVVSQSLCQRLCLKYKPVHVPITGIDSHAAAVFSEIVTFNIRPRFASSFSCSVDALVLSRVSSYAPRMAQGSLAMSHLEGLELADPNFMNEGHIDVLPGSSIHSMIIEGQVIKGKPGEPIASLSLLGWLISGSVSGATSSANTHILALGHLEDQPLDRLLQNFWSLEEIPNPRTLTAGEISCEEHFLSTHSWNEAGRYVVRLPFKEPDKVKSLDFTDSYTAAYRSLLRMEAKFVKDAKLKVAYSEFMSDFERLGHMALIPVGDQSDIATLCCQPHHGV